MVLDVLSMKGPFTIAVKQIILKFKGHEKYFLLCIDFVSQSLIHMRHKDGLL